MISVCIPVYNKELGDLIQDLYALKKNVDQDTEIIVIDDASEEGYRHDNRKHKKFIDHYVELQENVGRAEIRNHFLQYASNPYLLFIDGDSRIIDRSFLRKYLDLLKGEKAAGVIVGGSVYPAGKPEKDKRLRWKYGTKVESRPAVIRNRRPWASFKTNNVIIPADVLKEIPFDASLKGYGHEDTLMGYRLKKAGVKVYHVDNAVLNSEPDTNEEFLKKSEEAVVSLFRVLDLVEGDPLFVEDVRLLVWVKRLAGIRMAGVVGRLLSVSGSLLRFFLQRGIPSLLLLDLYKLHLALTRCVKSKKCHILLK